MPFITWYERNTYASDIRHKNKFLPHLELKKHISRMIAKENKFPLPTLWNKAKQATKTTERPTLFSH